MIWLNFRIVLWVLLVAVTGCTKKETRVEEGNRLQILHLGNGGEPSSLDPHLNTGMQESEVIRSLIEGLVNLDPQTCRPIPGAAESWEISKDGKTYTFHIRQNAKWSNGDPVTAEDFVFSWRRVLNPSLASEYAYMLYAVKGAQAFNEGRLKDFTQVGVKALDPHTLKVDLERPIAFFLSLMSHHTAFPVHRKSVMAAGAFDSNKAEWTRPGKMVGNGAFVLKDWQINKHIQVVKNPHYWGAETVRLNEIYFHSIDSMQTEERMFRNGDLHGTMVTPQNKIETYLKEQPGLIKLEPMLVTYFYRINTTRAPLNDSRVRRALSMAIDRKKIVEQVTKGHQMPAYALTPPNTIGYTPQAQIEYNPTKARKLLAEAGYPNGKGLRKIEVHFNTLESHKLIAEAVQQMWKQELGIEVDLTNEEWKVFLQSERTLNFDLARAGWVADYPDPDAFLGLFVTGGGNNRTGWGNPVYDSLVHKAAGMPPSQQEKRFGLYQEAEKILLDESPIIPIYIYTSTKLVRPEVRGYFQNVLDQHDFKYVYLESMK